MWSIVTISAWVEFLTIQRSRWVGTLRPCQSTLVCQSPSTGAKWFLTALSAWCLPQWCPQDAWVSWHHPAGWMQEDRDTYKSCLVVCSKPHISLRKTHWSGLSGLYLLISVAIADIKCVHGLHNGHNGLQGVAVDDGNELQAFFKRVTIFVDNSDEKIHNWCVIYSQLEKQKRLCKVKWSHFICLTIVLFPDSPAPIWKKKNKLNVVII